MTKTKTQEQKVLFEFLEKYPELEEHRLYSYAAISAETYERIKRGKIEGRDNYATDRCRQY